MLEKICNMAQIPVNAVETSPLRHQRMLVLTLRAMTLRALISALQRGLPSVDEELCRTLTLHLRGLLI